MQTSASSPSFSLAHAGDHPAVTLWLTGLSGAGKSTLAHLLCVALQQAGKAVIVLDGDQVRKGLSRDLGFSPEDRGENIRRVAEVARLANGAGVQVVAALISPIAEQRLRARSIIGADHFIEIHLSAPLAVCAARDAKGLYAKAHAGALSDFTGISAGYEVPTHPDLRIDTAQVLPREACEQVMALLRRRASGVEA